MFESYKCGCRLIIEDECEKNRVDTGHKSGWENAGSSCECKWGRHEADLQLIWQCLLVAAEIDD